MRAPTAALVCVGSELLAGQVNTHQAWLSTRLRAAGFELTGEESVPDDVNRIKRALLRALRDADAAIVCGGLGPTFDDVTREAAGRALGLPLSFRPALWARILKNFARYKAPVPEENKRQALVLRGAEVLHNANGSAPGQFVSRRRKTLVLLPGPAAEMYPMFEEQALPRLRRRHAKGLHPVHFSVRLSGVPESVADESLDPVRARWPRARFTILAGASEVSFHASLLADSPAEAARLRARLREEILAAVGRFAHGEGEATLESAVGARLKSKGLSLAAAESCTAGLLGGRITSVAGSSGYFLGGVIAYSNEVKVKVLGVAPRTIVEHGAVSPETAIEMARGARRALKADLGVSITGVAGPGGGSKDKPVGLVYVGLAGPGTREEVRKLRLYGARESVRLRATTGALRAVFDALG